MFLLFRNSPAFSAFLLYRSCVKNVKHLNVDLSYPGQYLVAIPASLELWLLQERPVASLLLFLAQAMKNIKLLKPFFYHSYMKKCLS